MIDPVCLFHGKKQSEHDCLFCCLCFETLTPETCHEDEHGIKWDICKQCDYMEKVAHYEELVNNFARIVDEYESTSWYQFRRRRDLRNAIDALGCEVDYLGAKLWQDRENRG